MRRPFTWMVPESGFISPRINLSTTDFPAPLAPSSTAIRPARTLNVTSCSTTLSSNASDTWSKTTTGASAFPMMRLLVDDASAGCVMCCRAALNAFEIPDDGVNPILNSGRAAAASPEDITPDRHLPVHM